jgi:hypothetical protein
MDFFGSFKVKQPDRSNAHTHKAGQPTSIKISSQSGELSGFGADRWYYMVFESTAQTAFNLKPSFATGFLDEAGQKRMAAE